MKTSKRPRTFRAMWNTFLTQNLAAQIPNTVDDTVYCVYTDYDGDHTQPYTVLLGCRVVHTDDVPSGMTVKSIAGGTYQRFSAKGNLAEGIVIRTWYDIWNSHLDRAYTADFEVFGEKARNPEDAQVEIYIAVQE